MGWSEKQRRLSYNLSKELDALLGAGFRGESAAPKTWSPEEEATFQKEINQLFSDYEEDLKEITQAKKAKE